MSKKHKIAALEHELEQLIRVIARRDPRVLVDYVQMNYPRLWEKYVNGPIPN